MKKCNVKKYGCFLVVFILILTIATFYLSYGSWNFIGAETRSDSYDSLGKNMMSFEFDVEPNTINWEGFDINGKKYMYFGPFPAFVRIVLNAIAPQYYGQWARVSCLIAMTIIIFSLYKIFYYVLSRNNFIIKNRYLNQTLMLTTFGFVLGTPIFYLMISARIYCEAIMWGVAWSIVSLSLYYYITDKKIFSCKLLFLYSVSIAFALLSKITFALPLYILCAILLIDILKNHDSKIKKFLCLSIPAGLGGVFQLIYNYERFGNIFTSFPTQMSYLDVVKKYGMFSISRLYDGFYTYLLPNKDNFSSSFPYISYMRYEFKNSYLYGDWKEPYVAITISSVFFTFLIIYFAYKSLKHLYVNKFKGIINYKSIAIICLILESIFICSFHFLTERYICEFVPLIFFFLLMFLNKIDNKYVLNSFAILLVCSVFITMQSTMSELMYFPNGDYDKTWVHIWGNIKQILL